MYPGCTLVAQVGINGFRNSPALALKIGFDLEPFDPLHPLRKLFSAIAVRGIQRRFMW